VGQPAPTCYTESLNAAPASTQNQLNGICYDAAGNLALNVPCPTGTFTPTYAYDAENRLSSTAGYTYSYDADGVRMEKAAGTSGTMYWPGSSGEYLAETDLTGTINEEYIYFNGQRLARVDRPSGTAHYYFSDKLGSASVIAGSLGTVQAEYFYYPYGSMQSSSGSDSNRYKYTGKERDSESGLDNFGKRYHASSLGRFMTPDPLLNSGRPSNPQTWNRYSYALNNPLKFADPTGLWEWQKKCGSNDAACQAQRKAFRDALENAALEAQKLPADSEERKAIEAAISAYGIEGDGNNVRVAFGTLGEGTPGVTDTDRQGHEVVKFDLGQFPDSHGKVNADVEAAAIVTHEGRHLIDDGIFGPVTTRWRNFTSVLTVEERRAYRTQSYVNEAAGTESAFHVWNPSWAEADRDVLREAAVKRAADEDVKSETKGLTPQ
jgi:RHS repeat-associated protein